MKSENNETLIEHDDAQVKGSNKFEMGRQINEEKTPSVRNN